MQNLLKATDQTVDNCDVCKKTVTETFILQVPTCTVLKNPVLGHEKCLADVFSYMKKINTDIAANEPFPLRKIDDILTDAICGCSKVLDLAFPNNDDTILAIENELESFLMETLIKHKLIEEPKIYG